MLVLTRENDGVVKVGGFGEVMVVDIRGHRVRLGFKFDKGIQVHRSEIFASMLEAVKEQIPHCSDEDKQAIAEYLFAEIEFSVAEKRLHKLSDAAKSAVDSIGEDITIKTDGDEWQVSPGPIAIKLGRCSDA